jgi:segregation and condensation protein B
MEEDDSFADDAKTKPAGNPGARFSLERLSSAFARLMGATSLGAKAAAQPQVAVEPDDTETPADDALPVTPQMIVEGMLFVGAADGQALAAADMASHIRGVDAAEVDAIVEQLNGLYRDANSAMEIVPVAGGYRLQLRTDLARLRDRFAGRVRAAKLTSAAVEVLSVVAYRQGVTSDQVSELRGSQSRAILAQLVRRQLVQIERPQTAPRTARYHTTERFNQLFGVASPADLPRSEMVEDA